MQVRFATMQATEGMPREECRAAGAAGAPALAWGRLAETRPVWLTALLFSATGHGILVLALALAWGAPASWIDGPPERLHALPVYLAGPPKEAPAARPPVQIAWPRPGKAVSASPRPEMQPSPAPPPPPAAPAPESIEGPPPPPARPVLAAAPTAFLFPASAPAAWGQGRTETADKAPAAPGLAQETQPGGAAGGPAESTLAASEKPPGTAGLLTGASRKALGAGGDVPDIPARPRYRDNRPPAYPLSARRAGHEGTVVLTVEVLSDGRVGDARIRQSSGHAALDEAALAAARRWLFAPGRRRGEAVAVWVEVPVRFVLQKE